MYPANVTPLQGKLAPGIRKAVGGHNIRVSAILTLSERTHGTHILILEAIQISLAPRRQVHRATLFPGMGKCVRDTVKRVPPCFGPFNGNALLYHTGASGKIVR
jgi:hypothetical protein